MLSNLPPGVTGTEDAFGPQAEEDVTIEAACYHCPFEGEIVATQLTWNYGATRYFECPQCGTENEIEVPQSDGMEASDEDWGDEDARVLA